MSASLGLYRLQLVDSRMDQVHSRLEAIQKILENNERLQAASMQVAEKTSAHEHYTKALKRSEENVKAQKIKIEQCEAKLYSGSIKNPKELQDLQNESVALKRFLATLEDRQLEAMLVEEEARDSLNMATQELIKVEKQVLKLNTAMSAEKVELEKEQEKLNSERDAARSPLDSSLLAMYENLRQQRRGLAVALISENACSACGTTLTPALLQNARSSIDLHNCSTCGRILYVS